MSAKNTTATAIIEALAGAVRVDWANAKLAKTTVDVAQDAQHACDLLTAGMPNGLAVAIFYLSDGPVGSQTIGNAMIDATIRVGIVAKRGLELRDGAKITGALPLTDDFKAWMGRQVVPSLNGGKFKYAGMSPIVTPQGSVLSGYYLNYRAIYAQGV